MANANANFLLGIAIATAITFASLGYLCYRKQKNSIPKKWTAVGKVQQLCMFPLKSARRREINSAECTPCGLRIVENNVELRDRCLVVYGEGSNEFKTARTYPKLILVEILTNQDGNIILSAPGQDPLVVKLPNPSDEQIMITLHKKEPCPALDCGDEAAEWLSQYLLGKQSGSRLGFFNNQHHRNIEKVYPSYKPYIRFSNNAAGLYQDLTSYHLLNQSSVDALNEKSPEEITALNFRPNILVDGPNIKPYAEEDWVWIKIGDTIFRNVKPCTRCVLTTIHPEEGVMSKKREPLTTLLQQNNLKDPAHIKSEGKMGVMGIHLEIKKLGEIAVGDEVYIA